MSTSFSRPSVNRASDYIIEKPIQPCAAGRTLESYPDCDVLATDDWWTMQSEVPVLAALEGQINAARA